VELGVGCGEVNLKGDVGMAVVAVVIDVEGEGGVSCDIPPPPPRESELPGEFALEDNALALALSGGFVAKLLALWALWALRVLRASEGARESSLVKAPGEGDGLDGCICAGGSWMCKLLGGDLREEAEVVWALVLVESG
jgi:hypothetical protein